MENKIVKCNKFNLRCCNIVIFMIFCCLKLFLLKAHNNYSSGSNKF